MRAADYIVDIGPGAGAHGGQVVACRARPAGVLMAIRIHHRRSI